MACSVATFPVFTDRGAEIPLRRKCLSFPMPKSRSFSLSVSAKAAADASVTEKLEISSPPSSSSSPSTRPKKSKVPSKNQQVMLRFVWMDKNIGIAVDHVVPGHGTVPLSPYYFWPRKDAWEEIKTVLESKKWISRKQTILLLNQATDVINLWQQNATG